jgi:hypothetical protein
VNEEPIQTNAADPEQIALGQRSSKDETKATGGRWRLQLSTYEGRRFLWDEILADGFLFAHIESEETQKLGVRNRALKWWARSQEFPDLFLQMQGEAMKRESTTRRTRRSERAIATDGEKTV